MNKDQKKIDNQILKGKTLLLRVDLNVPVIDGKVQDDTRIKSVIPSIKHIINKGGNVVLCSHFGRPKGEMDTKYSLKPMSEILSKALGGYVDFSSNCIGEEAIEKKKALKEGDILLLENLRFHKSEEKNEKKFSKQLTASCDLFVNDAFSCSHRDHASITGVTKFLPSFFGMHLQKEIEALDKVLEKPKRPVVAVVGGSKVSTKIDIISNLIEKMDFIIIGGAMANTFLAAEGNKLGKSLYEKDVLQIAHKILNKGKINNCKFILPEDVVVSKKLEISGKTYNVDVNKIPEEMMALDIGVKSIKNIKKIVDECKTLLWNGPLGAFEIKPFDKGTNEIAKIVSMNTKHKKLVSVAGGGDTISALNNAEVTNDFTYVSTAGGAFLEWLEGKELPGISALHNQRLKI